MPKRKQYTQSRIDNLKRKKADKSNDSDENENPSSQVTPTQQTRNLQVHDPQASAISNSTTLHGPGSHSPHQSYFTGPGRTFESSTSRHYLETVDTGPENMGVTRQPGTMMSSTGSNSDSELSLSPLRLWPVYRETALDSELLDSRGISESVPLEGIHGEPWHEYEFIQESKLCRSMAGGVVEGDLDSDLDSSVESENGSGGDSDLTASVASDSESERENETDLAPEDSADESGGVRVREVGGSNAPDHSWEARKPPTVGLAYCALRDLKLILKPPQETGRGQKDLRLPLALRTRLERMSSFLWIYTDKNMLAPCPRGTTNGSRWTSGSLQAAHAQQSTPYRVRNLQKWSKAFINDRTALPLSEHGKSSKSCIDDDDVTADIALHLQGLGQYVRSQDIVDYLQQPGVKEKLQIKKVPHLATAKRWMQRMGY
jgi:hypothetical protein